MKASGSGIDLLFLHFGRLSNRGFDTALLPAGLPAVAAFLERGGVRCAILNVTRREAEDKDFRLEKYLAAVRPALIGVGIHWHQQAREALRRAALLKKTFPGIPVVAGGFTASWFRRALLAPGTGVDFVIRGDAEVPLLALVRELRRARPSLSAVPNLYRRAGGSARGPRRAYCASAADLGRLSGGELSCLADRDDFLRCSAGSSDPGRRVPSVNYVPGRGCAMNCVFCGGGRRAQLLLNRRRAPALKPLAAAAADLAALGALGVRAVSISCDPALGGAYYADLLRTLAGRKERFRINLECWRPPSEALLRALAAAAGPGSSVVLSPDTGDEGLRARIKGFPYTDAALRAALRAASALGLGTEVYFTTGLPFETRSHLLKTIAAMRALSAEYGARISFGGLELEPAAPMFTAPSRYGIKRLRSTLADFSARHEPGRTYYSTDFFSEREIMRNVRGCRAIAAKLNARPAGGADRERPC